ncbi:hypothetical protein HN371_29115 [Candidatus Poribacteria bacterium]|jgi:hypothetical protein|nr:hypothetical protein [Candidatus Poribacteria bacterium]MBT5537310.1 hypothetical protein [Candidatus Poribacteria bacterium]MBT5713647.1 hypothetical protein [Candidatus Poribacteria bacterium]MBT7097059.1 hypothetical protein [Candidatus Poribacteria bacterium]
MSHSLGPLVAPVVAVILMAGCSTALWPWSRAKQRDEPRLNHIQALGSHNSYKQAIAPELLRVIAERDADLAQELDYSHIALAEQLDLGLRQLEIDIFHDPDGGRYANPLGMRMLQVSGWNPGPDYDVEQYMSEPGFKVLHVQDIDFRSNCMTLKRALEELVDWSEQRPGHLPIAITMNANDSAIPLAGSVEPLPFDAAAFDALDAEIRATLPPNMLITPDDVRGKAETLESAVLAGAWPPLSKARGKFLFVLDEGGDKQKAYVDGHPSLRGRVLFVAASPGTPEAAFLIMNDPIGAGAEIARLVDLGYVVRTRADSGTIEARAGDYSRAEAAAASGAHFISTDYYQADASMDTGYRVRLPDGVTTRWNPVTAAEHAKGGLAP